jgi:hypothetical protein
MTVQFRLEGLRLRKHAASTGCEVVGSHIEWNRELYFNPCDFRRTLTCACREIADSKRMKTTTQNFLTTRGCVWKTTNLAAVNEIQVYDGSKRNQRLKPYLVKIIWNNLTLNSQVSTIGVIALSWMQSKVSSPLAPTWQRSVQMMLDLGADPNLQDIDGESSLHKAVRSRQNEVHVIETLMERGVDIHLKNIKQKTALSMAESESRDDIARLLRRHGATLHFWDMKKAGTHYSLEKNTHGRAES